MRYFLPFVVMLSALPAAALQAATPAGVTVGVTGGSLGAGPELSYALNRRFAVRASAAFIGVSGHGNVSDFRYDGNLHFSNFGGTVDWHPFAGDFRLSAGARVTSEDRVRIHGTPTGPQTYGGITFSPAEAGTLSGEIRTASVSPVATLGYAHTTRSGFMFGLDGGVMFHSHPRVENIETTGQLATNPAARDELDRQVRRLEDKVRDFPYYPVLQLSLGYRF